MPGPLNLIDESFGSLVVIGDAGWRRYAGKKSRFWHCRCSCGRQEEIYQSFLTRGRATECRVCARGPCVNCGAPIERDTKSNTCSEQCRRDKQRKNQLKHYAKKTAENPDYNKLVWQQRLQRMAENPDVRQRHLDVRQRASRRYRSDPRVVEREREYQADHYASNADEIRRQRRERWASLPMEERWAVVERRRAQSREWRRRWRERLAQDPERYEEQLEYQREVRRRNQNKRALAELQSLGATLGDKMRGNDGDNSDE